MANLQQRDTVAGSLLPSGSPVATISPREVVAVVLTWRGRVGLFKRSRDVASDAGKWHCITGHLDECESPLEGAVRELFEETGLRVSGLVGLEAGSILELADAHGGNWRVHTFHASTGQRRLELNWEHESYRWVLPARVRRFDGQVDWLHHVIAAVGLKPRES